MKERKFVSIGSAVAAIVMLLGMIAVSFGSAAAQQPPTATPNDPLWLAFDAARTALEEKLQQEIRYVKSYTYEEAEFQGGISACKALGEEEKPEFLFFGWRFVITLLNGSTYEVRTSFNYQIVVICDQVTVTSAEPTAATTPVAGLPAPIAGPVGPGGLEVGGQVTGLYPEAVTALTSAGMRWIKIQVHPGVAEGTATAFVTEAHSKGFKILLSVVGDPKQVMDGNYQNDFAAYLGRLAKSGADAIEVWNEPNIEREWPLGQISGANYTVLLAKAFNAIKSNNGSTLVISGAPAPTGFFGAAGCTAQGCNDDVFYQQMAAAGAAQYMDCVGLHYNEGIVSPLMNSGDPRDNYPTRYYGTNLGRALANFPGKQGCFTEIGYLSGEDHGALPGHFAWAGGTSVAEHAQWLGEAVGKARAEGNVRLMVVFNVNFTNFGDDPMAGYAIIRKNGSCPACEAIRKSLQ
ncbi:MAG: hypothetical protein K8I82_19890 [Anaerolineae bacterium]|nr:hypothetical protein [Anaerolineae bacterium]